MNVTMSLEFLLCQVSGSANANFSSPFLRGWKLFFKFKFEIRVKLRREWCKSMYDSFWICQYCPTNNRLRRHDDVSNLETTGKLQMNRTSWYTIWRELLRWFQIWSRKIFSTYVFKRLTGLKNCVGGNFKVLKNSRTQNR